MATMQELIQEVEDHEFTQTVIPKEAQPDHQKLIVIYEYDGINSLSTAISVNIFIKDKGLPTEEAWFQNKPPYMTLPGAFLAELETKIGEISTNQGIIRYRIHNVNEDDESAEVETRKEINSKISKPRYFAYKDGENIAFTEME